MTPAELASALRLGARGRDASLAAVELLVWHEYWIRRMAFHPDTLHVDRHGDVDWVELALAVVRDEIRASTSPRPSPPSTGAVRLTSTGAN
jgi:hypothetical protein